MLRRVSAERTSLGGYGDSGHVLSWLTALTILTLRVVMTASAAEVASLRAGDRAVDLASEHAQTKCVCVVQLYGKLYGKL